MLPTVEARRFLCCIPLVLTVLWCVHVTFAGLLSLRSVNHGIVPVFHVYLSVIAGVDGPRVPIELSDAECSQGMRSLTSSYMPL
jgi:hypothetical protein